jgi:hypothetical protein
VYTEILRSIAGIHVFPVMSLVLFVAVFTVMLIRVVRMDVRSVERMATLPLDNGRAGIAVCQQQPGESAAPAARARREAAERERVGVGPHAH